MIQIDNSELLQSINEELNTQNKLLRQLVKNTTPAPVVIEPPKVIVEDVPVEKAQSALSAALQKGAKK